MSWPAAAASAGAMSHSPHVLDRQKPWLAQNTQLLVNCSKLRLITDQSCHVSDDTEGGQTGGGEEFRPFRE